MLGAGRIRRRAAAAAAMIQAHPLAVADPCVAGVVSTALVEHVRPRTQGSYETAAAQYESFCDVRGLAPYPVDAVAFCGWLVVLATYIDMGSIRMYMSGVRYADGLHGYVWQLEGNEFVRRTLRYLKRRYPIRQAAGKLPVTLALLRVVLCRLPGWPNLEMMSRGDAVFAVASVIAVSAFLRGGEFLTSSGSDRPILRRQDMVVAKMGSVSVVAVRIAQPKARWWLDTVSVPCFPTPNPADDEFCPFRLWCDYVRLVPGTPTSPAFIGSHGRALGRDWMVARTAELVARAGFCPVDELGQTIKVYKSSWRAGAVRSAVDAKVPAPLIKAYGRWKSMAWEHYLMQSSMDLHEAARAMCLAATATSPSGALRVGGAIPADVMGDDDAVVLRRNLVVV
jgi:hypothetical protein